MKSHEPKKQEQNKSKKVGETKGDKKTKLKKEKR
jgi:hypothetical protein